MTRSGRRLTSVVVVAVMAACVAPALAQSPNPKRRVAVLEFRKGSAALQAAAAISARLLRESTSLNVIDADDARKKYGSHLGRDVFACKGATRCIARIGRKLGASEVLLVGVSEFGDVILTLQRISARNGRVITRIAEALAQDAEPTATAMTRYLKRVMPKSDFIRYGTVRIKANEDDAEVFLGGKRKGVTPLSPLRVRAPATYKIRLTKPGFVPFSASVDVPPDAVVKVEPTLVPRTTPAWYKRWWVAAIAGTVMVGAVAIGVSAMQGPGNDVPVRIPPQ